MQHFRSWAAIVRGETFATIAVGVCLSQFDTAIRHQAQRRGDRDRGHAMAELVFLSASPRAAPPAQALLVIKGDTAHPDLL